MIYLAPSSWEGEEEEWWEGEEEKLATLAEAFGEEADPVENFEAFVMLRLCDALQRCVQPDVDTPAAD